MDHATPTRIMIIDDHPLIRDGLRARLSGMAGIAIVAETDGAMSALSLAAQQPVDLVLMDINLADMSGIALTKRFRQLYPNTMIVILSMHDHAEYVQQALHAGARGYVLKQAQSEDIIHAIRTVSHGGMYLSAALACKVGPPGPERDRLTAREQDIIAHIASGKSNKQIACALDLSVRTVEAHRCNIKHKLGVDSMAELVRFAVTRHGP